MFCIKCEYCIEKLENIRVCPECGSNFDPDNPKSYIKKLSNTNSKLSSLIMKCIAANTVLLLMTILAVIFESLNIIPSYLRIFGFHDIFISVIFLSFFGLSLLLGFFLTFIAIIYKVKLQRIAYTWYGFTFVVVLFVASIMIPQLI